MSFAAWSLSIGLLLITLVLSGTFLKRLPLSTAMLYLTSGVLPGRVVDTGNYLTEQAMHSSARD